MIKMLRFPTNAIKEKEEREDLANILPLFALFTCSLCVSAICVVVVYVSASVDRFDKQRLKKEGGGIDRSQHYHIYLTVTLHGPMSFL